MKKYLSSRVVLITALVVFLAFFTWLILRDVAPSEILTLVILFAYFVPAFVAQARKKRNSAAILVLNLFLGWTFIGWVVALVWACTSEATGEKHS